MVGDGVSLDTPCNGRYLPPESLAQPHAKATAASDVYSFAMLCLELLTGLPPFHNIPEEEVVPFIRNGTTPERPKTDTSSRWLSNEVWDLLTGCRSQDPTSRPDMSSVVTTLRLLQRARREASMGATC